MIVAVVGYVLREIVAGNKLDAVKVHFLNLAH